MQAENQKNQFSQKIQNHSWNILSWKIPEKINENNGKLLRILHSEKKMQFQKNLVAHATGNCANELFHWKSNPNVNSEFGFGFSAFDNKDLPFEK